MVDTALLNQAASHQGTKSVLICMVLHCLIDLFSLLWVPGSDINLIVPTEQQVIQWHAGQV